MRMGFGLVGLLVTIGVIIVIWSKYTLPVAQQAVQTRNQVEQKFGPYSGASGVMKATDSMKVQPQPAGSRPTSLLVTDIVPGGPMAAFGLRKGDEVIEVGPTLVRDDADMAKAMLFEAPLRQLAVVVMRDGKRTTIGGQ
jgi:S1-C subfamily serine protease